MRLDQNADEAGTSSETDSESVHMMHHIADMWGFGPKLAQALREHALSLEGGLTHASQLEGIAGLGKKRQAEVVRYLQLKTTAAPAAATNGHSKKRGGPEVLSLGIKEPKQQKVAV